MPSCSKCHQPVVWVGAGRARIALDVHQKILFDQKMIWPTQPDPNKITLPPTPLLQSVKAYTVHSSTCKFRDVQKQNTGEHQKP